MSVPILVLEIGLNANGDEGRAIEMIRKGTALAKRVGFPLDALYFKFQKRDPEVSTPKHMWDKPRVSPVSGKAMTYIEYKHEIEFWKEEYSLIDCACTRLGVGWFVSAWDVPSADFIFDGFPQNDFIKIPSPKITDYDLALRISDRARDSGMKTVISTGMSTAEEIDKIINNFPTIRNGYVLSCTSTYPCPDEEVNLRKMESLIKKYGHPVGFSSHSVSPFPAIYSALLGAQMVEVHYTLDRALPGSDHAASLELPAIELIMRELIRIPKLMGSGEIKMYPSEMVKRESLRGKE